MLNKHDILGRDDGELHREHLATGGHPSRRNDLVPEGDDVLDGLTTHQVRGAFDLDYGFVGTGMVAVLEVEAEGEVGGVLEEDFADGANDDVVDGRGLYTRPSGQCPLSECFANLQANNRQVQGKSLFGYPSRIFILTDFYSRTYKLAPNGESKATWYARYILCGAVRIT
jgi:hypothetical protein